MLDFFAGSGTTLHATALINAQLGGARRCILVSYNEPGEKVANKLHRQGLFAGDADFDAVGVSESVTWPRVKFAVNGKRDDGVALKGSYLDLDGDTKGLRWGDGFDENVEYFRLDFLDPDEIARGDAFKTMLPVLWLVAGSRGERGDSKGSMPWFMPKHSPFAVLITRSSFARSGRN